jgi:hypothetical protein
VAKARAQLMPGMPMMAPGFGGLGAQGPGRVNLPFTAGDSNGIWYIYPDGALRQQMGQPVYQQGAVLSIDGMGFNNLGNQAVVDAKTNELILQNNQMNGLTVTRRILFDKEDSYVRYTDVLHNSGPQDRTVNLSLQTNLFWGVQQAKLITDPRHNDTTLAWCAMTPVGRSVLEVFGGAGAKVAPSIQYQTGSNFVQASISVDVPAGKDAAVMHLHMFTANLDAGTRFVNDMKAEKIAHSIPPAIRRLVVNFDVGQQWMADLDILRGDLFDVVELRGGDRLKGLLQADNYHLETFYGTFDLPPRHVIAMVNIGAIKSRQLLVADDGEVFGGHLDTSTVNIALSSGQTVSIPIEQVSRVGCRRRADEPDEWTFDKPLVMMRGGDRFEVRPPADKIEVATRYGLLELDPSAIAAIVFQGDENPIHEIDLTDGSKFVGLLTADELAMQLDGVGPDQVVHLPVSEMMRIQFLSKPPEAPSDSPSLSLLNNDNLIGDLEGDLTLETAFGPIALDARQISKIASAGADEKSPAGEIQVTLWDGSTMSGQISDASVHCHLLSGPDLNVPIPLIRQYVQPHPQPSPAMTQQITAAAGDLSADDWRQRDRAEETLESMGTAVIGVLRDIRSKQSPEGQQRIDGIIKKLQSEPAPADAGGGGTPQ